MYIEGYKGSNVEDIPIALNWWVTTVRISLSTP